MILKQWAFSHRVVHRWPAIALRSRTASSRPPWHHPWSATYATASALAEAPKILPPKIQLRDYQEEAIKSVIDNLALGHRRLGISLATGAGKTVIFTHLIDRIESRGLASQTLILVHRKELVEQAAHVCERTYPDKTIEIEMAKKHASGLADITVASIQSITSKERLEKFDPERFKLVLVDEAHHIVAAKYLHVLEHFSLEDGCMNRADKPTTALVGVSATFSRHDGMRLGAAIDHIVYHKDYLGMIKDGWLAKASFTTVQSGVDLSKVRSNAKEGDFQINELSEAVNNQDANQITVQAWLEKAKDRKATLVFCVDLNHVRDLTAMFRAFGIDARFITSDTDKRTRSERFEAFKRGDFPVLLNCGIFTEGTDIPHIDCVLLARPTRSRNLLVQMIGRGLRLHPNKENCHVIDMVTSLETGIITTPTLFGLDPTALVDNADVENLNSMGEKRAREKEREEKAATAASDILAKLVPSNASLTFTHYESINDLMEDTSGERYIRQISSFAWIQIDASHYILSNRDGSYIRINRSEDDEQFTVLYLFRLPYAASNGAKQAPLARPREIATATTFEDAVHAADTFASEKFPYSYISKSAAWRRGPASEAQVTYINKSRDENAKLEVDKVTKGRAADMITKLHFGIKGKYSRIKQAQKKVEAGQEKNKRLRDRLENQAVQVGPVARMASNADDTHD